MTLEEILRLALEKGATDVHLKAGVLPVIRLHGSLQPIAPQGMALTSNEIEGMALTIMDDKQRTRFDDGREVDLGHGIQGLGRFRVSIFKQRGSTRMVIRNIPYKVPNYGDLNLPSVISNISREERGLILITGVSGSGKSSTLAAIIDDINRRENKHILTIEDPIEFLIRDRKSLITQREIGIDTNTFSHALRAGLRQDPDVILIGEMRDKETIESAILAAETGHMVLSTLHTLDATETINRILAAFDANQQSQIRLQLSAVLKAVVSQRLCRKKDGTGQIPACEIMVNTARVRELIQKPNETASIQVAIEEGAAYGMQSFDQHLMELLNKDLITFDEALLHCTRPEDFRIRAEGFTAMDGKKWAQTGAFARKMTENWQNLESVEIVLAKDRQNPGDADGDTVRIDLENHRGQDKTKKKANSENHGDRKRKNG